MLSLFILGRMITLLEGNENIADADVVVADTGNGNFLSLDTSIVLGLMKVQRINVAARTPHTTNKKWGTLFQISTAVYWYWQTEGIPSTHQHRL